MRTESDTVDQGTFDLGNFTLGDMSRLGGQLRTMGAGARTMEEVANRLVGHLHERLVDAETGTRACALVRFFKTHPYSDLDEELQQFSLAALGDGIEPAPGMKCLTLLATAGDQPEWNRRQESAGHRAIPLASEEIVSQAPMISRLLSQLGVRVEALLNQTPELLVEPEPSSFNVFYVPDAKGSDCIPAQEGFVKAFGIESVLGFGGMLPTGDIFAVILFAKIRITRETAALFRTLALNVKMAALDFDHAVFVQHREQRVATKAGNDAGIKARVSTLEQLLDVYERSVLEQSNSLYTEQERLRLQTTLLESQGEASLDGILSVSIDGQILFGNNRLAEMWGIDSRAREVDGCALAFREMAGRTADPNGFLERATSIQEDEETRDDVALADGRTFERYTAPIARGDGVILGRVWHFRDVTEVKQIGRLKDEFISAVSHELRTPLTSIRGSLDLIASGVMGEVASEAMSLAKIAQGNCERLTRLINDILDIEKIESGLVDLELTPLALEPLVEQSVEAIRAYGQELGVEFVIENSVSGARVRGCADRLIQVMENLLSNAAKFSPHGATVCVSLTRHAESLRVSVTDRGVGIAPEFHSRVFQKFAQIPSGAGARKEGTGLGLNIARATVERHGGSIGFTSKPGVGSCFYFELPEEQFALDGEEST